MGLGPGVRGLGPGPQARASGRASATGPRPGAGPAGPAGRAGGCRSLGAHDGVLFKLVTLTVSVGDTVGDCAAAADCAAYALPT